MSGAAKSSHLSTNILVYIYKFGYKSIMDANSVNKTEGSAKVKAVKMTHLNINYTERRRKRGSPKHPVQKIRHSR